MGFVQNLRMNRVFPTGGMNLGWSGELPMYGGDDPLRDITNNFAIQREPAQMRNPSGGGGALTRVAQQNAQPQQQPLRFGGVVGPQSNPGADILERATANAERMWQDYKKPQITAGEILAKAGIKPNEQFPGFKETVEGLDIDKQLDREAKRTNIDATKQRIQQGERRLNLAEEKQKNPNMKFIPVKGGNIMAFDPTTGDSHDTGVATNTLTDKERLEMQQDFAMRKQDDAQAAAAEKPPTATQQGHAITNRINEMINRNPAWREFINPETGMVAPIGAGGNSWLGRPGLDEKTRQTIIDQLYGPASTTPAPVVQPPPTVPTTPTTPSNMTPNVQVVGTAQQVPAEQRQVGKSYTMGNGKPGIWTGRGFRPQE